LEGMLRLVASARLQILRPYITDAGVTQLMEDLKSKLNDISQRIHELMERL
jgi:hypothetical protein